MPDLPSSPTDDTMNMSYQATMPDWVTPELKAKINYDLNALKDARPASRSAGRLTHLFAPPPRPLTSYRW